MEIFAYYTPHRASPVNSTRAGTVRFGSDQPTPINVNKGFANDIIFAFRDNQQKAFWLEGQSVTATIYNHLNVELLSKPIMLMPTEIGLGHVVLSNTDLAPLTPGLYNMVLSYTDQHNDTYIIKTMHSLHRFALNVVQMG